MTVLDYTSLDEVVTAPVERDSLRIITWVLAGAAVIGWLPFIRVATSPDEGGYLMVASQWGRGTSLYGNYWVDRPPLLFVIHDLAVRLGGTPALRIIGVAAVVASVFLASAIARTATAAARHPVRALALATPAAVAAIFMTTPLFGTTQVDGELLTIPFVLTGVLAYVRASSAASHVAAVRWAMAAGAAATCAVMVKQNAVDVFVFALAVLVVQLLAGDRLRTLRVAAVFAGAALGTLALILGLAAARGTSPGGLWDSVVTFRFQAAIAIHHSTATANSARLVTLLEAAAVTFAPALVAVLAWQVRRRPSGPSGRRRGPDLRSPAAAVLATEVVSIAGGGNYWLHYLLVLVPGMVLLAIAASQRPPTATKALAVVLTAAAISAAATTAVVAHVRPDQTDDTRVSGYLRENSNPGDTAVVAFGHPNMLWDARLTSPYDELWSLPVRVRDSRLVEFTRVLGAHNAPTWVVVSGPSLATWGVDSAEADKVLAATYHRVVQEGRYDVWRRNSAAGDGRQG